MMQIVDALEGKDGLLKYWGWLSVDTSIVAPLTDALGISYGTALGATAAAMFPDRMDKVVLDGVLNMDQYYAGK